MEQSFSMQINMGVANEGESDEIKRIFLEGNPVLLAITMVTRGCGRHMARARLRCCHGCGCCGARQHRVCSTERRARRAAGQRFQRLTRRARPHARGPLQVVSLLHSVFDFMAFKNDVAFWKENRSMEGLSARSIMINAVCQLIILLYLFDNETSTVVLISSGAEAGAVCGAAVPGPPPARRMLLLRRQVRGACVSQRRLRAPERAPRRVPTGAARLCPLPRRHCSRWHRNRVLEGDQGV